MDMLTHSYTHPKWTYHTLLFNHQWPKPFFVCYVNAIKRETIIHVQIYMHHDELVCLAIHTHQSRPTSGRLFVCHWGRGRSLWCSGLWRQGSNLNLFARLWGWRVRRDGDYRCCCYWSRRVASTDWHLGGRGEHGRGSMAGDQLVRGYVRLWVGVSMLGRDTLSNMVHWSRVKTTTPWWLWSSFSDIWKQNTKNDFRITNDKNTIN